MRCAALALALAFVPALSAYGDDPPTTKPIRYTWIATSCETWNCAAAALVLANGDKHVIALPTGHEARPWVILKRVEEGAVFIPDSEPFACEVFDGIDGAGNRFHSLDGCHAALMMNVPDGRAVVISLRDCATGKRRASR